MKKFLNTFVFLAMLVLAGTACEKSEDPDPEKENPFKLEAGENGFSMGESDYPTPFAFIELWGETDDQSANFDVTFTDGAYDSYLRKVTDYDIKVYFDVNSPNLDILDTGQYYIDGDFTREPYRIVEAYIEEISDNKTNKYPVLSGTVNVSEKDGFYKVEYDLEIGHSTGRLNVTGIFAGFYNIIDQRINP